MRRKRIEVVYRECPRCGKRVAGLSRSIHGADAAHAQFAGLCEKCATDGEKKEIEAAVVGAILRYPVS